jgi:putative multiple sugar transport system substrate-binding protein
MKKLLLMFLASTAVFTLAACQESTIKIGVVLPDAAEERWANQDGRFFREELEALGAGYEFEILFSDGDEGRERANVESLIARGAKVIIITVEGAGAGAVQAAKEAGIPIVAHDRLAKSANEVAEFYTTFNSWNVGKAMGAHLVQQARAQGYTSSNRADLAIFAGRVADFPNATYFFGGAMEEIIPNLDIFNIINVGDLDARVRGLSRPTEATFNDATRVALQNAMGPVDTDWNPATAAGLAEALVANLSARGSADVFVLAPNDDTSAAIRLQFAELQNPYTGYFTTGQDASDVALAALMGDPESGQGRQTMTVFKDTSKLVADSVRIARNLVDGNPGLTGLTSGPSIEGAQTAYSPIDTLVETDRQTIYDLIFRTGYKDESAPIFNRIDFTPFK